MLEEQHCSFHDAGSNIQCGSSAEFSIWNLEEGTQTPSCKAHIGDLLGGGENRVMPIGEQPPG
jgi:hypothetical protein